MREGISGSNTSLWALRRLKGQEKLSDDTREDSTTGQKR